MNNTHNPLPVPGTHVVTADGMTGTVVDVPAIGAGCAVVMDIHGDTHEWHRDGMVASPMNELIPMLVTPTDGIIIGRAGEKESARIEWRVEGYEGEDSFWLVTLPFGDYWDANDNYADALAVARALVMSYRGMSEWEPMTDESTRYLSSAEIADIGDPMPEY